MADCIVLGGGGGVSSSDVSASKAEVLTGYYTVTTDSNDEVVEGDMHNLSEETAIHHTVDDLTPVILGDAVSLSVNSDGTTRFEIRYNGDNRGLLKPNTLLAVDTSIYPLYTGNANRQTITPSPNAQAWYIPYGHHDGNGYVYINGITKSNINDTIVKSYIGASRVAFNGASFDGLILSGLATGWNFIGYTGMGSASGYYIYTPLHSMSYSGGGGSETEAKENVGVANAVFANSVDLTLFSKISLTESFYERGSMGEYSYASHNIRLGVFPVNEYKSYTETGKFSDYNHVQGSGGIPKFFYTDYYTHGGVGHGTLGVENLNFSTYEQGRSGSLTVTLDVSSLSGEYYVGFSIQRYRVGSGNLDVNVNNVTFYT